jgi:hypothetical protein
MIHNVLRTTYYVVDIDIHFQAISGYERINHNMRRLTAPHFHCRGAWSRNLMLQYIS